MVDPKPEGGRILTLTPVAARMSPIDPRQCYPSSWVPPDEALPDDPARSRAVRAGYVSGTLHVVSPAFAAGAWRYQQENHQCRSRLFRRAPRSAPRSAVSIWPDPSTTRRSPPSSALTMITP